MADLTQEIHKITGILREKYQPDKIILYGSVAAGTVTSDSDIDMLIIKNTHFNRRERIRQVSDLFLDRTVPFDPIVFTERELEEEIRHNPVMRNIVNSGKVLYERQRIT